MYETYVIAKHVLFNQAALGNHSMLFHKSASVNDLLRVMVKIVVCGRERAEVWRQLTQLSRDTVMTQDVLENYFAP